MERNLGRVQNAPRDGYWTGTSHTRKCMIPVSFSFFIYFSFSFILFILLLLFYIIFINYFFVKIILIFHIF